MVRASLREIQRMHTTLSKHGAKYDTQGRIVTGSWRRGAIKAAGEELGITRQSIYNYIEEFPQHPQRAPRVKEVRPTFVTAFLASETVQNFLRTAGRKLSKTHRDKILKAGLEGWRILEGKDPFSWTEEDYRFLWNHPDMRDDMTGQINFHRATGLRKWMVFCGHNELKDRPEFTTKGLKRPKGAKKTHWLKTEFDISEVVKNIRFPDTLLMFHIGIQCGGRFSSIKKIEPQHISYSTRTILMYEPKVKEYVERHFLAATLETLRKYIFDFKYSGSDRIFPRKLAQINDDLKQAGIKGKVAFPLTTHTAMKHTFVSLASNHGVSIQVVANQTGTDPATLIDFYAGLDVSKIRHELLGEEREEPSFHELMQKIDEAVRIRYEEIKTDLQRIETNGKRVKARKKRPINWNAVKGMVKSEKTPEHFKKKWKEALDLHNKGLSDMEVKKRMGW